MSEIKYNIHTVKVKDLLSFSEELSQTQTSGVVPIIRSRAKSLLENPLSTAQEVGLCVAIGDQGECIGYMGLMPGLLRLDGQDIRVYWTCTGFVERQHRRIVSKQVIDFAKENVETIIATGNNANAERMYRRLKFHEFKAIHTIAISINTVEKIQFQMKWRFKQILKSIVKPEKTEDSTREQQYQGLGLHFAKQISNQKASHIEYIEKTDHLSQEACELLNRKQEGFVRNSDVVQWMLKHPWWPGAIEANDYEKRYFFYSEHKNLKYRVFDIKDTQEQKTIGFVVFAIIKDYDIQVKMLDYEFYSDKNIQHLIPLAFRCVYEEKAHTLLISPEVIAAKKIASLLLFHKKQIQSTYFVWTKNDKVLNRFSDLKCSMVDGDTAFW